MPPRGPWRGIRVVVVVVVVVLVVVVVVVVVVVAVVVVVVVVLSHQPERLCARSDNVCTGDRK